MGLMGESILLQEFVAARLAARDDLVARAVDVFERAGAVEGHLLGSLGRGDADELSDVDMWITFTDADVARAIEERFGLYQGIAPVVLVHEAKGNAPAGGHFSLVIFETDAGPLMADFQFSPLSSSVLDDEARSLFAHQRVPRGKKQSQGGSHSPTRQERVDFVIAMAATGLKYLARGQGDLAQVAVSAYEGARAGLLPELPPVDQAPSYCTLGAMLDALAPLAGDRQQRAVEQLLAYQTQLARLYPEP